MQETANDLSVYMLIIRTKIAVTYSCISQTHTGRVDKIVKSSVRQEHVRDTLEMRYMCVLYAWCTLIYVAVGRCVFHACLGSKDF